MRIFLIALFCPCLTQAQNLLLNSSFEEENICSEYKINCAPEAWIYTVPSFNYYFKEKTQAHTGNYFIALIAGHSRKSYYRTFVRSRLLCRLQKDKTYQLRLYVKSNHPFLDSIGIYFSEHDFLFDKRPYHKIDPTLFLTNAVIKPALNDTNWQPVSVDYKATGKELFITLGNFRKRDVTGPTNIEGESNFFVLFDDVSLIATDPNERLCKDWKANRDDIYGQDERHQYLEKIIKLYRNKPPPVIRPGVTLTVKVDTLVIPDVLFAFNSFVLSKRSILLLDSLVMRMRSLQMDSIIVSGHTDYRGDQQYNKELSWRRANSVAAYLQKHFSALTISKGYGSEQPVADNRTAQGRLMNRRVEIFFYIRQ